MNKIPVGQTITEACRFTFFGLERVIGVIWLPVIVLTIAEYFVMGPYLSTMAAAIDSGDPTQAGPVLAGWLGFSLFQLVMQSIIAVAICREILKPLERPLFLRFSFGGTELRVTGAMLGLVLLLALIFMAGLTLALVLGGGSSTRAVAMLAPILLIAVPPLVYLFVRLAALVAPAAVIDGGLGLERSWHLLKGNVGRLILIFLALLLPLMLVESTLQGLILGPDAAAPQFDPSGGEAAMYRYIAASFRQLAANLPMLEGLKFVLAPFQYGLMSSVAAYAYKALTAGPAEPAIGNGTDLS